MAPSPWSARQRVGLVVVLALGAAGLITGYVGTSGTLRVSRQVVWVNVAGIALLVSGIGVVGFLTAGRQAIGRRRLALFGDVGEMEAATLDLATAFPAEQLMAGPAMTRYHRADCSFLAGKSDVVVASTAAHQQEGRRPCGVCLSPG